MEIQEYLNKMKEIQYHVIDYLDSDRFDEENTNNLIDFFSNIKIQNERDEFKSFLYLISKISNNHHQTKNFFDKIFQIINFYSVQIKNNLSNLEIFNIFKTNKQIIRFLKEKRILEIDQTFSSLFFKLNVFSHPQTIPYICELIQDDNIIDFVKYTNQTNYPIKSAKIDCKIFETNSFLINKNPTLIEYSAFCGSIQIFQYLQINSVELTSSLWIYAIHGSSNQIINILEENKIIPNNKIYDQCLIESIKCYHNEIVEYLLANYISDENAFFENYSHQIFECYNFNFIKSNHINESSIYDLYVNKYTRILKLLLKNENVDINKLIRIDKEKSVEQKSLLHFAIENNDIEIIQFLLKNKNVDVDITFYDIIKRKLEKHYQCTQKTALNLAVENNNFEIVNLLLESTKECGNTYSIFNELNTVPYCYENYICEKNALYIAFEKRYMNTLNLLLEKPFIDVNIKYYDYSQFENEMNEKETTLLNKAVSCNNFDLVKVLLSKPDIDVNIEFFYKKEASNRPFVQERYYKIL